MKIKLFILILAFFYFVTGMLAQDNTIKQTVRGTVIDRASNLPLPYVSVGLEDIPQEGTMTNAHGQFVLNNVPIGRHTLIARSVGYEPVRIAEMLLTSAKEVYLQIQMTEQINELGEVVVIPKFDKAQSINNMSLAGGNQLNVEQAARYAGGMDDPARLASSFAGVSPSVGNNGISVHGNSPNLLQWRLEGVEIPNPNHFADVAALGGGILTSLSSNVLGNSDFFTGAFPAEYNNAVSGVFDMRMKNGNSRNYQHTMQLGTLGIDLASEGPFSRKHNSSYLFNYRYSTTGLMNKIGGSDSNDQLLDYQDLNFKLNFPTKSVGIFSVWTTALKDKIKPEMEKPEDWEYYDDRKDSRMEQTSAASGLNHKYFFENNASLNTTLAITYSKTHAWENINDAEMEQTPYMDFNNRYTNLILTSVFNKKFSNRYTNKTGFTVTNMHYNLDLKLVPFESKPLETISNGKGNSDMVTVFSSSLFELSNNISATLGVNGQYFTLNDKFLIEPRASVKWKISERSSIALAYGLHSRMEKMDVYFVKTATTGDKYVNKDIDFAKAHHIQFSFNDCISDDMNLKIEPYFQFLFHVPVIADSSFSILNRRKFYIEDALVNKGRGRNYGVDITFEKYLTNGLYYLTTASLFRSEYCGGDKMWNSTRYNRNYIINGLIGKEWMMGRSRQNILTANLKLTLQGGDHYSPVDEQATLNHADKETQYDETKAFSKQLSPIFLANYTVSFRINKRKVSHEFAIKSLNVTGYKEYFGHEYNLKTGKIEPRRLKNSLFNISYRLDF